MSNLLTRIVIGGASADVALVKSSAKPKEAKHEVRTFSLTGTEPEIDESVVAGDGSPFDEALLVPPTIGETPAPAPAKVTVQGVTDIDGRFVDLTERLYAIDENTRLDGVNVECTVPIAILPRTWVRDAYFIVPNGMSAGRFLAYVWSGLTPTGLGAVVRWTKRTDQFLGAIVPRGSAARGASLMLLEFEWSANMRAIPENARLDVTAVPDTGREQSEQAFRTMQQSPRVIMGMRNERAAQRAELLEATREGREWDVPDVHQVPDAANSLGDTLIASVL